MPKMNFGLSAHLEYKGFDLSISTYGALGYHVSDHIYNALNSCYGYGNKDVNMANANRWAEDGSYLANVPRTFTTVTHPGGTLAWNDLFSDRQIQNAAYWKIANVELGYNIPNNLFGGYITGARIYVSAQNLHTFTGYKGITWTTHLASLPRAITTARTLRHAALCVVLISHSNI